MAKKKGRYEPIDEDMIRNLIGGVDAPPRLVPKQVPTAPPPETPTPEIQTESQITRSVRQSETNTGHNKGKGIQTYFLVSSKLLTGHLLPDKTEYTGKIGMDCPDART